MQTVRMGILGAATIARAACVQPASLVPEVSVDAIAARDVTRARAYADKHHISRVYDGYAELIAAPDLDAVYVPLPNALHAKWTLAALDAGKHVLCEKPLTANATEARRVADAAERAGLVVMEAMHYRHHPVLARALEIIDSGEIGAITHVEAGLSFPLLRSDDIRWRLELAGGATMDAGCYPIHALRTLGSSLGEPSVTAASALLHRPEVDRAMTATFAFPGGATGRISASLLSRRLLQLSARVRGDAGEVRIFNYIMPQMLHRLTVRTKSGTRRERVPGGATYTHQLRVFADAVRGGAPVITDAHDAVHTMTLIDEVYRAAGLAPRSGALDEVEH